MNEENDEDKLEKKVKVIVAKKNKELKLDEEVMESIKRKYYKFPKTEEEVKEIVVSENNEGKIIILDFYTNVCQPCKFLDYVLCGILKKYEEKGKKEIIQIVKINLDINELVNIAITFSVKAVPTVLFIYNAELVKIKMKDEEGKVIETEILVGLKDEEVYVGVIEEILKIK